MLIAASVFALSMFGGDPAHARAIPVDSTSSTRACITPTRTGTFRLLALSKKGNEPNTAILMLENIQGCLEVTFVADGKRVETTLLPHGVVSWSCSHGCALELDKASLTPDNEYGTDLRIEHGALKEVTP